MEWLVRLNEALHYVEENLEGEIDIAVTAQITCCSTYHFQRMFSFIAGITFSEYVRRRRMTMAAFDLQNGSKVLDTAIRYGYGSPTSFNRAFQAVHGITPSAAQKENVVLKAYPRIKFQISIKGDVEMDYRIVTKEAFRIVGVSIPLEKELEKNFENVPQFWNKVSSEGQTIQSLCAIMDDEPKGILGASVCMSHLEQWKYFIAASSSQPAPEGMEELTIAGGTWAVFSGTGPMPTAIQEMEKRIMTEWFPASAYEYGDGPDIEVYKNANTANAEFEIWVPVAKKAN